MKTTLFTVLGLADLTRTVDLSFRAPMDYDTTLTPVQQNDINLWLSCTNNGTIFDWRLNNRCCILYSGDNFTGDWDKFCIQYNEDSRLYENEAFHI